MKGPDSRLRRPVSSNEGAVAVTTAIVLTVLLALLAFIVDYGLVRADTRDSQRASDSAALAGAAALDGTPAGYLAACQQSVAYLEATLPGLDLPASFCNPFAPGSFTTASVTCALRGQAPIDVPATADPLSLPVAPVYSEMVAGDYTIRLQMPVRNGDSIMGSQASTPAHDGVNPCQRIGISVRHFRDSIFGAFAGSGDGASGHADAVARYGTESRRQEYSTLIVLDPTGCEVLNVSSNNGKLLVENLLDGSGAVVSRGLITADTTGAGCGNNKYALNVNGSGARLCSGIDPSRFDAITAGAGCQSATDTLFTPSRQTGVTASDSYGKAVSFDNVTADRIGAPPTFTDQPVTRRPVDHKYNCRASYPNAGTPTIGRPWHPLWENTLGAEWSCQDSANRGANLDELLDDLAAGTGFLGAAWETIDNCNVNQNQTRRWGNGSRNLFFNCNIDVKGTAHIDPLQYVVVNGFVDVNGLLQVNVNNNVPANQTPANKSTDAIMVVRGTSGPGNAVQVSASASVNINNTLTYLHAGALSVDGVAVRWVAPQTEGYDADGVATGCVERQSMASTTGTYFLPTPECFENLALWSNNANAHKMRGGGQLDVVGVFFAPNAGRSSGAFDLSGGSAQRLTLAQFFTYRFVMGGSATLSMRPDPNTFVSTTTPAGIFLIR